MKSLTLREAVERLTDIREDMKSICKYSKYPEYPASQDDLKTLLNAIEYLKDLCD